MRIANHAGHGRVGEAAADVIDTGRPGFQRRISHLGTHGVDGHGQVSTSQFPHDRQDPFQFLGLRNPDGAGPCRFAAYIDDVRSRPGHGQAVLHGSRGLQVGTAIRERVRSHVDDSHD